MGIQRRGLIINSFSKRYLLENEMKLHKPIKAPSLNKNFANEHMHLKSHY